MNESSDDVVNLFIHSIDTRNLTMKNYIFCGFLKNFSMRAGLASQTNPGDSLR
jgi:hypothetical protein